MRHKVGLNNTHAAHATINTAHPAVGKNVLSQLPAKGCNELDQLKGDRHSAAPSQAGQLRRGLSGWNTVNRAGNNIIE